jgi:outer membrane protein TolC
VHIGLILNVLLSSEPPEVATDAEVLSLEDAIAIAEREANEIVRAKADVLLVDVERALAIGAILPSVNFAMPVGYNVSKDVIVEVRNPATVEFADTPIDATFGEGFFRPSVSLRQLVFDGGRWWLTITRADDIEAQRKASLEVVRNDVRLNVVRQFYNLERSSRSLDTFRLQLEVSVEQLARAKELSDAGRGKKGDLAAAQRNLAEDRVDYARREFLAAESRRSFNVAIGREAHLPVKLVVRPDVATATVGLPPIRVPDEKELLARALAERPEIVRSKAGLDVIGTNVAIRKADYWPRLTVGAAYRKGWTGAGSRLPERVYDDPSENFYVTFDATLSWNWFDGLRTMAGVEEAEIVLAKAVSDHENLERAVAREVSSRRQNLELQMAVYDLARDAIGSADEAVRQVRALFEGGKGTTLELRDAELKYTQAKLSAINARLDVEVAREELRRAVGGPVE